MAVVVVQIEFAHVLRHGPHPASKAKGGNQENVIRHSGRGFRVVNGEFVQFLESLGDGDGIHERDSSLIVSEGLVLLAQGQMGQTTFNKDVRFDARLR